MRFEDWFNKKPEEVPEKFHSFMTGKAFDHCMICNKYLLSSGTRYMIEKAIKKYPEFGTYDVVFEFAICENCGKTLRLEMSDESKKNIEDYFKQNSRRVIDMEEIQKANTFSEVFTQKCIIKDLGEKDISDYQLIAYCDGPNLSVDEPPLLLSELAAEEIQELISQKTREEMDRFSDEFLGLPPEFKKLMKDELILF